jgi:glutamate---cysteine ligase / carboxylate-amine ligase
MEFEHLDQLPRDEMPELDEAPTSAPNSAVDTNYSFGIEEEYFLAHLETMEAPRESPDELFQELARFTSGRAGRESLQAQVEVSTEPITSAKAAMAQLRSLRKAAASVAEKYGFAILAAGTHPTAEWEHVAPTPSERYVGVMDALQMIGRRNMLCGMHVHVELPDPGRRVDVMVRMLPYVPLFLALSTSSPFWRSQPTGLKGYRLAAYDELPRTGLPDLFPSTAAYERYVGSLVQSGVIEDASHIWWTLRPSHHYPTLELRAPDCCTRLDDAVAIACLFRALARHLFRNKDLNADISPLDRAIAVENKWRAQRFGVQGSFATRTGPLPMRQVLELLLARVDEDAAALGCTSEIRHCRNIISGGTSADVQLKMWDEREHEGSSAAIMAAASWVAEATSSC